MTSLIDEVVGLEKEASQEIQVLQAVGTKALREQPSPNHGCSMNIDQRPSWNENPPHKLKIMMPKAKCSFQNQDSDDLEQAFGERFENYISRRGPGTYTDDSNGRLNDPIHSHRIP
jgi:hypothetical protein